jgi:hypothetical protein
MSITDDILTAADIALAAVLNSQRRERLDAMTRFMYSFEEIAQHR